MIHFFLSWSLPPSRITSAVCFLVCCFSPPLDASPMGTGSCLVHQGNHSKRPGWAPSRCVESLFWTSEWQNNLANIVIKNTEPKCSRDSCTGSDIQVSVLHMKFIPVFHFNTRVQSWLYDRTVSHPKWLSEPLSQPTPSWPSLFCRSSSRPERVSWHCNMHSIAHPSCRPLVKTALMVVNKPMTSSKILLHGAFGSSVNISRSYAENMQYCFS